MEKYLKKYNNIMLKYRNGEFGESHLSLDEILSKTDEPNLIDKMCLSELKKLHNSSFGMSQHMVSLFIEKEMKELQKMDILEKKLQTYCSKQYCEDEDFSVENLARKLNLTNQEVNYLTVAVIMPFDEIVKKLDSYESTNNDDTFAMQVAEEYDLPKSTVMNRLIEVRKLYDYRAFYGKNGGDEYAKYN